MSGWRSGRPPPRPARPWSARADLSRALDLKNPGKAFRRVADLYKVVSSTDTLGGRQKMLYLRESGIFQFLARVRPRKAAANRKRVEAFQRWPYEDVLPRIRRPGSHFSATVPSRATAAPDVLTLAAAASEFQAALAVAHLLGLGGKQAVLTRWAWVRLALRPRHPGRLPCRPVCPPRATSRSLPRQRWAAASASRPTLSTSSSPGWGSRGSRPRTADPGGSPTPARRTASTSTTASSTAAAGPCSRSSGVRASWRCWSILPGQPRREPPPRAHDACPREQTRCPGGRCQSPAGPPK
jgi:prophage antirepressor-like protein